MTETSLDRSYAALFAVPTIKRLLLGMTVARIAGSMVSVAVILFSLTHYNSPALTGIVSLAGSVEWMAGIQFYLQAPIGLPPGHAVFIDTEWALTAVESTRFWRDVKLPDLVSAILSVDISAWNAPGRFNQKEAYRCTRDEIAREVWGDEPMANHDR